MSNGSVKDTGKDLKLQTRVFDLRDGRYGSLSELAQVMGISISQVYRVREGKRRINEKFVIGAIKAFPDRRLDELFYLESASLRRDTEELAVISRHKRMIEKYNKAAKIKAQLRREDDIGYGTK